MTKNQLVEQVVREVLKMLDSQEAPPPAKEESAGELPDLTGEKARGTPLLDHTQDPEALLRMMERTSARIGVGRAGPRLKTKTLLTLRADHAAAQDAVFMDVDPALLEKAGLPVIQTLCTDRDNHLTRPDLGRQFAPETLKWMRQKCKARPQVQIYVSDGLSSRAVEANVENILPALVKGLEQYGIGVGTPFFVKFGRVPAMDVIGETVGSEVTCVLIGERPGLATAESMSAYIAYKAAVGMPESRRTVVSNIHGGGISAVEAGAYIADVIKKMLELKVSGVDLKL